MTGKLTAYVLSLFAFFMIFLLSVSFYIHISIDERINDICYDVAETVSTKGIFTREVYDYLKNNLNQYGEYETYIQLEKKGESGESTFFYGFEQIENKELSMGDRVIISATNKYPTFFSKLTNSNVDIAVIKVAVVN